jgi:hypothetical protein
MPRTPGRTRDEIAELRTEGRTWQAIQRWSIEHPIGNAVGPDGDAESRYTYLQRQPGPILDTNHNVLKRRRHLIDDQYGLGIYFRTRAALIAVRETQTSLAQKCVIKRDHLQDTLEIGNPSFHDYVSEAVAHYALSTLRQGDTKGSPGEFRTLPFLDASAPADFVHWLKTGELPLVNFDLYLNRVKPIMFYETGGPRQRLLGNIKDFLALSGVQNVFVVYHDSMSFGLSALGRYLCKEVLSNNDDPHGLPFCYIPCARHVLDEQPFRFADVIGTLDAFYKGNAYENPQVPNSGEQLRDAIERVRRAMSRRPAVLVFDGCSDSSSRHTHLRRLIADDPLTGIYDSLLYPLIERSEGWDPGTFYKTRIIVLADGPCEQLNVVKAEARPLPPPRFSQNMTKFVTRRLPDTGRIIMHLVRDDIANETKVGLLDSLIRATSSHEETFDVDRFENEHRDLSPSVLMRLLADQLSRSPKSVLDLMILRFCALSDTGLRQSSLAHLLDQWAEIISTDAPQELCVDRSEIRNGILHVTERYPWVLVKGRDEHIAALDDDPHTIEYPEVFPDPLIHDWDVPPSSLSIRSASLRSIIISDMEERGLSGAIRVMHRLSSEECLRQQTVIARHSRWQDSHDLRLIRRSLEGLYHGFRSIDVPIAPPYIDLQRIDLLLPLNSGDVFRRLYGVIYRRELESPPLWELSRVLGGDRVKADLLWHALTAPVSIKDTAPSPSLERIVGTLVKLLNGNDGQGMLADEDNLLIRDLLIGLMRAAYHSDNRDIVTTVPRLLRNLGPFTTQPPSRGATRGLEFPLDRASLVTRKLQVDNEVIVGSVETAAKLCEQFLTVSGLPRDTLSFLSSAGEWLARLDDPLSFSSVFQQYLADIEAKFPSDTQSVLKSEWSDLLYRYADTKTLRIEKTHSQNDRSEFLAAFLTISLAERLMTHVFARNPLEFAPSISARATRVFIRICTSLAHLYPQHKAFLLKRMRYHTDALGRSFARYPMERASLLIVEASMLQLANDEDIEAPLRCLAEADQLLAAVSGWHRARLRLLLERSRLFLRMASSLGADRIPVDSLNKNPPIRAYLDASAYDANMLKRLAEHHDSSYWHNVAEGEEKKIWKLCSRFSHTPDHLLKDPSWSDNSTSFGDDH